MDTDLILVVGVLAMVLAVPALLSAWVDDGVPRAGAILVLIGGVLLVVALSQRSHAYTIAEMPDVFMRVIGRFVR
jgi:hypothetical protein